MKLNLVLLGPPGAGKGYQAELISSYLKIPTISTGNLIRDKIASNDEESKQLSVYVNQGRLVPDNLIGQILKSRVSKADCEKGFILDGFPRSLSQAKLLDDLKIDVDKVIEIDVNEQKLIERLQNRRICKNCGATYNLLLKKPKVENRCDLCGAELVVRKDDDLETIKKRLEVFRNETKPLISYYKTLNKLFYLNGNESSEEVRKNLFLILDQ